MEVKLATVINNLSGMTKQNTSKRYVGPLKNAFLTPAKSQDLLSLTYRNASNPLDKVKVLTRYCAKRNLRPEFVIRQFDALLLDDISKEYLLNLVEKNAVSLYKTPEPKIFGLFMNRDTKNKLQMAEPKGILNYINGECPNFKEAAESLKELLIIEKEGKIAPENIAELLKLHPAGYNKECKEVISMLKNGVIANENISQALLLIENKVPLEIFDQKNLAKYSRDDLYNFVSVLQSSKKNLPQELLNNIKKELSSAIRVNTVPKAIVADFLSKFENYINIFATSKHTINDLYNAGGIKLEYSRQALKENILTKIKKLPEEEQNKILSKFGLHKKDENILSGLPVMIEDNSTLNPTENSINNELKKFLKENKIILPEGFEEFQTTMESICKTFPEFLFTIGSTQHQGHSKPLAEHMLMALQENMKNPLYNTLNSSDKKVLGISTLLHDLNKIEHCKDPIHPLTSSESVKSILERMDGLSADEKDRIVNFIENHHWLSKIGDMYMSDPNIVSELVYKFRRGNDFKMAKIFAESDLKSVNDSFFSIYGNKLNSETVKAVEKELERVTTI